MGNKENKQAKPVTIDYHYQKISIIWYIPLLLIAGFVPLIVYAKYVDLSGTMQALYWTGEQQYLDFFSYWKSQWVMWLTLAGMIIYGVLVYLKKLPFKKLWQYYIPMLIYCGCVILSTVFAKDIQTALWGFVDMYQGCFVLLAYMGILFLTINFVNSERELRWFAIAFLILMYAEGILGISQYFGFDLLQTKIGQSIILPNYIEVEGGLEFTFGPKTIYGTLFNTNYVGSFACLMLPMSVAFLCASKNWKERIVTGGAVVLMVFVWIGCNSRAGYLGVASEIIVGFILFRKIIANHYKIILIITATVAILVIGLNFISQGQLVKNLGSFGFKDNIVNNEDNNIKNLNITGNRFSIATGQLNMSILIKDDKMYILDQDDKEVPFVIEKKEGLDEIVIDDKRFSLFRIYVNKSYPGGTIKFKNRGEWNAINFYIDSDDNIKIIGSGGRLTEPKVADVNSLFKGMEYIASGRGYIWGRSLPILKECILMGAGADCFPFVFPQDDFIEKLNLQMDANMVIDKPHNMYMQIGINTGLLSLLVYFAICLFYLLKSINIHKNILCDFYLKCFSILVSLCILGYLVASVFNDHIVSVSPMFWMILGLGICVNNIIENENIKTVIVRGVFK